MGAIVIPVSKSLTVCSKFPNTNIMDETITVGNGVDNYSSYLFFDTSIIPSNISDVSAQLVLFKMDDFYDDNKEFSVYPLLDYFSKFTTYNNTPKANNNIRRRFCPFTTNVSVEINISLIVKKWLSNTLINKGIVIKGNNKNSSIATFGSALNKDVTLIPFIMVAFKELPIESNINIKYILSQCCSAPCTGKIIYPCCYNK